MDSQAPRFRRSEREGSASGLRILLTLVGIVVAVGLVGWGVLAAAGAIVGGPTTTAGPKVTAVAPTPTTAPLPKNDSAIPPSELTTKPAEKPAATTPVTPAPAKAAAKPAPSKPKSTGYVVVIDPGHQGIGNNSLEPIGPRSSVKKPAVAGGASDSQGRPESLLNLQVSLKIRDALQAQGVKVIMVRTSQKVDIPNSKRAKIANDAHANLFLRVHADSSSNSSITGFLTLVPGHNQWTGPIVASSGRAGRDIQAAALAATGAKNRGVTPRSDLSGFNWSKVPTALVEMGMMSNPGEDRKMFTPAYQQKLAAGISAGVIKYLRGQ